MSKSKRYTDDYKEMTVDLYTSGMTLYKLSSEYDIAKSTITGWIKDENEILKKAMAIFATKN